MEYKTISKTIIKLRDNDLLLRDKLIASGELFDGYNKEMEALHINNATELEIIIDAIGYPTIDRVGEDGSQAAWLVIQHAISLPDFMRKCVLLLKDEVDHENADPVNYAYLSDRIAVFEGKEQLFGTQFDWDVYGKMSPHSYDDIVKVNSRRISIGLNSLEDQTDIMRKRIESNKELPPADLKERRNQMNIWKKSVGWVVDIPECDSKG